MPAARNGYARTVLTAAGRLLYHAGLADVVIGLSPRRLRGVLYHAIEDRESDWNEGLRLTLDRRAFDRQIAFFRRHYRLLSLAELDGPLPRRALCISFDDGFASVGEHALPVLRRHDAPAAVYLVTRAVEQRPLWFNTLNHALRTHPDTTRAVLTEWLDAPPPDDPRDCLIVVQETFAPTRIEALLRALERRVPPGDACGLYLTESQVREMQRHGIEFGFHTRDHYHLPNCPAEVLARQLERGSLDALLDSDAFAYPYGYHDERVACAVRDAGFGPVMAVGLGNRRRIARHVDRVEIFHADAASIFAQLEVVEPVLDIGRRSRALGRRLRRRVTTARPRT